MNYKRKVKVNKDAVYQHMYKKSCRLSIKKICEAIHWKYDTVRHDLLFGEIMPDTLQDIADYLEVKVEELQ